MLRAAIRRSLYSAVLVTAAAAALAATPVVAKSAKRSAEAADAGGAHPASRYYRRAPQVRGFVARRGGYSYQPADTVNTYGDARTQYGGANTFRDPMIDRQTPGGPFDHGFFFDSGIAPRGGNSPYMN